MNNSDVKIIFQQVKDAYLRNLISEEKPIAFILGGQPASGKSGLTKHIIEKNPTKTFLFINGDVYREFHPNFIKLKNSQQFTEETQLFSNVFTEEFIDAAINNNYNIIIEGTMRNKNVPSSTAEKLRLNGYHVEAYCISAPDIFTELGIYTRYKEELTFQGWGRLADVKSHNEAVDGLCESLDFLYDKKLVEKIRIYSYQVKEHIKTYELIDNRWTDNENPSKVIISSRESQLRDKEILAKLHLRGIAMSMTFKPNIRTSVIKVLEKFDNVLKDLKNEEYKGLKR